MRPVSPALGALTLSLLFTSPVLAGDDGPAPVEKGKRPAEEGPAPVDKTRTTEEPAAETAPAPSAPAPKKIPTNRLYLTSRNSLRLNPIGLQTENTLLFQHRLMDSDSALFNNTFVNGGLYSRVTPAFGTIGGIVGIQPIALLRIDGGAEVNSYFGTFDQILSWDDPAADYSDDTLNALGEAGENAPTGGWHAFLRPTFQIKGGPIAIRSAFSLEYWNLKLPDGDTLFYDFTGDMLTPNQGWTVFNDTDVLYFTPKKFVIGARYSRVAPRYEDKHYGDGTNEGVNNTQQRVGLIGVLPVGKKPQYSGFHSQALIVILSYYVQHTYRSDAPIPYFAFVYSFTSDFLKH